MKQFLWMTGLAVATVLAACNKNDYNEFDQIRIENQKIEAYLAENSIDAQEDQQYNFYYKVIDEGSGRSFDDSSMVKFTYKASTLGGPVVMNDSATSYLIGIIRGLRYGIPKVKEGGKIDLYLPSPYAFGQSGNGSISKNTPVYFQIEAKELVASLSNSVELELETEKIEHYLDTSNLEYEKDPSGVYYKIEEPGTGDSFTSEATVKVAYKGTLMNGTVFDQNAGYTAKLTSLIKGWQIGVPKVKVGGKIKLIIPSTLAYDDMSSGQVQAHSILFFDVEVLEKIQ
ncbi:hypothetical protein COR50_12145 [Chitinophaga caeni]|uniref:Peptidyl-prolyl cis-trans isomerase n=1 Tax=Chitinophaga caeni TaxID=2029983 RepID=A0A291QVA1_9BACT|nr:FKBP-type peptidyl-prolyl cis-trans isomerase [Chitinophaga caeni]ATL47851.1 hypothetical protein COR50_12145 [Chitinophaga caeni]